MIETLGEILIVIFTIFLSVAPITIIHASRLSGGLDYTEQLIVVGMIVWAFILWCIIFSGMNL